MLSHVALNSSTPGGSGDPPLTASVAFIRSAGDNGTAAIGDPTLPYSTMQAAYDAGARVFDLGVGTFAGITASGAISVRIVGRGRGSTTVTLIQSTSSGAVTVEDSGHQSFNATAIESYGASGASSSSTAGDNGGNIILYGVKCGTVSAQGGDGGSSSGASPGGNGGTGGNVTLNYCEVTSNISVAGGNGGDGTVSEASGSGGAAGAVTVNFSYVTSGSILGGGGGAGSDGGGGVGGAGNGGTATLTHSRVGAINVDTAQGTAGILTAYFSYVSTLAMGDGTGDSSGTINGSHIFIGTLLQTPAINAMVSSIGGVAY